MTIKKLSLKRSSSQHDSNLKFIILEKNLIDTTRTLKVWDTKNFKNNKKSKQKYDNIIW